LIGKMAGVFPEVVRQIALKGHQIGNHSYSHSNFFPLFRSSRIRKEIRETNQVLKKAGAGPISFFRPPFGVTNPNIARGLKNTGLKVAGWSIRSFDTRNEPAEKVVRRILDRIREGDVILLHETSRNILQILEQLLPEIGEKGLRCVSLDQLFGHRPTD